MKPLRVVLADDHALVRAGIRSLLERILKLEVVGEADNGREAVELVKAKSPDIVLMDIAMSGLNGLEATARISADFPKSRVIMLSMHTSEEYVMQALRAGASGYLLKDSATGELEEAIKAVSKGQIYLSPAISRRVIDNYLRRINKGQRGHLDVLTSRQREILQLIAEGRTTREIAAALQLSPKTVETHRMQLMERLDIHEVAGLVRYAIRIGLVSSDT